MTNLFNATTASLRKDSLNSGFTRYAENNISSLYSRTGDGPSFPLLVSFILVGTLGTFGNFLVLLVVWKNRRMRNPTNFLLTNLAISDLIFLLTATPNYVIRVLGRTVMTPTQWKHVLKFGSHTEVLHAFPTFLSTISLALLAIERYNALVHPMKIHRRLSKRSAKIAICVIWLVSMISVAPIAIKHENVSSLYAPVLYLVFSVIPAVTTVFCYMKIVIGIYFVKNICSQSNRMPQDIENKKLVKMLLLVTLIFMTSKIPPVVYSVARIFRSTISSQCRVFLVFLLYLSPCLNPMVYITHSSNYRSGVKSLLRSCLWTRN